MFANKQSSFIRFLLKEGLFFPFSVVLKVKWHKPSDREDSLLNKDCCNATLLSLKTT